MQMGMGLGWYIDPTPLQEEEFQQTLSGQIAFKATPDSPAYGKYDLLSTLLHETAHIAGFIQGNESFDSHIQTINGSSFFTGNNLNAQLTPDGSHLDSAIFPYDLLNTSLAPGIRKLPSAIDISILNTIRSTTGKTGNQTFKANLTSTPLIAILNSDFSIEDPTKSQYSWQQRGAANVLNFFAVLTEDFWTLLSNFRQTFTIPQAAKTLQFTLTNTQLGQNGQLTVCRKATDPCPPQLAPPDAFVDEVARRVAALLDTNTHNPLIATPIGLNGHLTMDGTPVHPCPPQTDSFLNLQAGGTSYYSPKVLISGTNLNNKRIVSLDISQLTPGTRATLYFDLLGFGAKDSIVSIDDIHLITNDQQPPIANNDTGTTNQGQPIILNILNNNSAPNGTIDPTTVQLSTIPPRDSHH